MDYTLIKDSKGIEDALLYLHNALAVGLDIETTSLFPREGEISLIQLSDGTKTYIIDCIELDGRYSRKAISALTVEEAEKFWDSYAQSVSLQLLIPFLEAEKPRKIIQNLKFESTWFQSKLDCDINGAFDTYLAGKLVDMPSDCKLDTLLEKYLGVVVSKEEQRSNWSGILTKEQLEYAARDAFHLPALREKLIYLLKQSGMIEVAAIEFNAVRTVAKMESVGFPVDKEMYKELVDELIIRRDVRAKELEEVLNEAMGYVVSTHVQGGLFGDDAIITTGGVNLNSPAQVKQAFEKMGVPLPKTNKQTITTMVVKYPQLKYLTDYRAEQILVTAFGHKIINLIDKKTGRIHASFWQLKPATGRFAASNPNLQQMPHTKEFRQCFRPTDSSRVFVICVDENSRVSTDKGLFRIKDIEEGIKAVQEDKSTQPILRVIDKGKQSVKSITTKYGYELAVTNSHQLRVIDSNGDYIWKKASELQPTDFISIVGGTILENLEYHNLPQINNNHFNEKDISLSTDKMDEGLAEFVGYLVGDGSFGKNYTRWVVNYQDKDLHEYLLSYSEGLVNKKLHSREYSGVLETELCSSQFSRLLTELEVSKMGIPDLIFKSKKSVIGSFLRGLFEADGSVTRKSNKPNDWSIRFSTSRESLSKDVQNILLGLNILSNRTQVTYKLNGKEFIGYVVDIKKCSIERFKKDIGFISQRKKAKLDVCTTGNRSFNLGFPNLKNKFQDQRFANHQESRFRNTRILNRQLSYEGATALKEQHFDLYKDFELYRLVEQNQVFLKVQSIVDTECNVYDLTVQDTATYIANGFVNHNCDYSGIELRILAQISQDPVMIDAFNNNRDLHSITAIAAFGLNCTEDEVKKLYKEYRDKAKGLNFGVVYGIGAGKYADNVGISQAQAKKAIRGFYDTYKGVEKYLYAIEDYGVKNRHVKTLAGRKLQLYFDPSNEKEISMARRNARNYPIQGTSADILKLALGLLYPRLKPFKDAWVVNIVHDEIIIECNREDGEAVKEILSEAMLEAAYRYLPDIYVEAEASVVSSWAEK